MAYRDRWRLSTTILAEAGLALLLSAKLRLAGQGRHIGRMGLAFDCPHD